MRPATELADTLAGFVAAEGTFSRAGRTFGFAVSLGASDEGMLDLLRLYLDVGHIRRYPRRRPHYDDESTYVVRRRDDLVRVVVPFLDEHLRPCHKREQFLRWRSELLAVHRSRLGRR